MKKKCSKAISAHIKGEKKESSRHEKAEKKLHKKLKKAK